MTYHQYDPNGVSVTENGRLMTKIYPSSYKKSCLQTRIYRINRFKDYMEVIVMTIDRY